MKTVCHCHITPIRNNRRFFFDCYKQSVFYKSFRPFGHRAVVSHPTRLDGDLRCWHELTGVISCLSCYVEWRVWEVCIWANDGRKTEWERNCQIIANIPSVILTFIFFIIMRFALVMTRTTSGLTSLIDEPFVFTQTFQITTALKFVSAS